MVEDANPCARQPLLEIFVKNLLHPLYGIHKGGRVFREIGFPQRKSVSRELGRQTRTGLKLRCWPQGKIGVKIGLSRLRPSRA